MGWLIVIIWFLVGALFIIIGNVNFSKFENYVAEKYRDEYNDYTIFTHPGRSRGMVKPRILLGIINPHPDDSTFNDFLKTERILATVFILWILPIVIGIVFIKNRR